MRGGFRVDRVTPGAEGWTADVHVPGGAPVFDGHFPDRPLVPGVALLLLVADLAGEAAGSDLVPVRLRGVRFLAKVGPGASLQVALARGRFTVRQGEATAVEGAMELASATGSLSLPALGWEEDATATPPLPHSGPARLVTAVGAGRALARIPAGSPLARAGQAPACTVLEAAAQGAHGGQGPAGGGLLVRVAQATFPAALLPVEAAFVLEVEPDGEAPPLRRFRASSALGEVAFAVLVS